MMLREFYKFMFVLLTSSLGLILNLELIWLKKDNGYCILGIVETMLTGPLLILMAQPQVKTMSFGTSYVGYNYLLKWLSFSRESYWLFFLWEQNWWGNWGLGPFCQRYWNVRPYIFFPFHLEKFGLLCLYIRTDFIQPYLIQAWMKHWMKGGGCRDVKVLRIVFFVHFMVYLDL